MSGFLRMLAVAVVGVLSVFHWLLGRAPDAIRALFSPPVVSLFVRHSAKLLWGTVLYNAFVVLILTPVLRRFFPPLSPWETVKGFFGAGSRLTYREVVPYAGTGLWIAGNALLFAFMNRNLKRARSESRESA